MSERKWTYEDLLCLRRSNDVFERVAVDETLTTPLLPWFSLSVHDLFT